MDNKSAYNQWSRTYDAVENKTRDLEAVAIRAILNGVSFDSCLEIGCGTGKNTQWLASKSNLLTAVDFSEKMLARAKSLGLPSKVSFEVADVTEDWDFVKRKYQLVSFSLILEHINNLHHIFNQASRALCSEGYIYIGELHPFKQYSGSKARYDSGKGVQVLECHLHHISDYLNAATGNGFELVELREFFDSEEMQETPRILGLLFRKI